MKIGEVSLTAIRDAVWRAEWGCRRVFGAPSSQHVIRASGGESRPEEAGRIHLVAGGVAALPLADGGRSGTAVRSLIFQLPPSRT
jgi:hypothetical protein